MGNHILNKPQGGNPNPNVDMRTGKVSLSIPLFTLSSPGGAEYNLLLKYESALLVRYYEAWNRELNTGLIAAGWNLNLEDCVFTTGEGADIYPYLSFKGVIYSLVQEAFDGHIFTYHTMPVSNYKVRYDYENDYSILYDENGIKYFFGKEDAFNQEKGYYDEKKGDYAQATGEYEKVRRLISNPDTDSIPNDVYADNTKCSSKETGVVWSDWVGPSYNTQGQSLRVTSWRLSHIEDAFNNTITFSYIQHISKVAPIEDSYSYTVCSYLYQIRLFLNNAETERLVFDYGMKETGEFHIEFDLHERPNGIQYKFQKLRITGVTRYRHGVSEKSYVFFSEMMDTWEDVGDLCKRQLKALEVYDSDDHTTLLEPGYLFDYYSRNDGVSISREGFTEENPLYNAKNGAVFGHIKKITYPTGKIEGYKYIENTISSVLTEYHDMSVNLNEVTDQRQILTPYDFHVVIRRFSDGTVTFTAYTWSIFGWCSLELMRTTSTPEAFKAYNHESLTDFSDSVIAIVSIDGKAAKLFRLSPRINGLWEEKHIASFAGKVENVSVSEKRLIFCTRDSSGTVRAYPYRTIDGDTYVGFSNPIVVTSVVDNVSLVCTACTADLWIVVVLSKESYTVSPVEYTGAPANFNKCNIKAFTISDDGTAGTVSNVGYIPHVIIKTYFTTPSHTPPPAPPLCAMYATIGGNITSVKKIERRGKMLFLRLAQKNRIGLLNRSSILPAAYVKDLEETEWGVCLLFDRVHTAFHLVGEQVLREYEYKNTTFLKKNLDTIKLLASSAASGNGVTYTYYIDMASMESHKFTDKGTFEYIYDGIQTVSKKDYDTINYSCMFRDNFFEAFYSPDGVDSEGNPILRRKYRYLDQKENRFSPIETGAIDTGIITYDEQAANVQKYLGYAGLALSILFLPLGFTSVFGIIMTTISMGLFVGSMVVQTLLNNSIKISMDPNLTYYGNRFLADGQTIWFRENGQEKLTSLGKGLGFSTEDGVRGSTIVDAQQFGTVLNFVPFYTNADAAYYTSIKNGRLKQPNLLDGISEGVTSFDYDPKKADHLYVYKGNLRYDYTDHKLSGVSYNPFKYQIFIDALVRVIPDSSNRIVIFSGNYFYFYEAAASVLTPKQKISGGIKGSRFTNVDAALYEGWNQESIQLFYIFRGTFYERVQLADGIFSVIGRGTISSLGYPIPFDKLDAAGYIGNNQFIVSRKDKFVIINAVTKAVVQGKAFLANYLQTTATPADTRFQFNYDCLAMAQNYTGNMKRFIIKKYLNGSLNDLIHDYVVEKVTTYIDDSDIPELVLGYDYDTFQSAYLEDSQSVAYRNISVWVEE